jgi:hypothetical protein
VVLTLSNGGGYFFQAETNELVNEWVSTCNYWAARTSKEPLAGDIRNMEYGWNRVVDALVRERSMSSKSSGEIEQSDTKRNSSTRGIFEGKEGASTTQSSYSVDKVFINDWKPLLPPTVFSGNDEESQMEALQKHVTSMRRDLEHHNELRQPMSALVCTYDLPFHVFTH